MMPNRLRVYYGPEGHQMAATAQEDQSEQNVTVALGEIFPLLAEAVASERTWLEDFQDDEVTISTDLYELILAYQHYRRPSA